MEVFNAVFLVEDLFRVDLVRPDLLCFCRIRDAYMLSRRSWKGSKADVGRQSSHRLMACPPSRDKQDLEVVTAYPLAV